MTISSSLLNEQESRQRRNAATLSVIVGSVLMILKFWAHNITDSQAIYSDALESIVNVTAAILALFVIVYAAKKPDQDHPYGHGKIEFFSAAFEGGLITFAAVFIIVGAFKALLSGHSLQHLDRGIVIIAAAGVANLLLSLYLAFEGKRSKSVALVASSKHILSDFWTSAGIIVGLLVVHLTNAVWLDSVIAIIVGSYLAFTGAKLVRESISGLMDEEDLDILSSLKSIFEASISPGIIQIHHVKVIRSGWYHHIDAHLVMPEFWNVDQAHEKITAFEKAVIDHYEYGGEMNFHLDPCRRAYCQVCDLENCNIRKEDFKKRMPVLLDHLRSKEEPEEFRENKKKD